MGNLNFRNVNIQTRSEPRHRANEDGPTEPKIQRMDPTEITSHPTSPQDHTETGNSTNNTGHKENRDPPPRTSPTRRGEATSPDHTQPSDSASPKTNEVTADGQPVPTPTMDGKGPPSAKNQPTSQKRAMIFSLEEDNGAKILQSWTKIFINDCQLISPSTITKDEDWRPDVEKSPIVIFYSSSSMSSIEKMKSHMENIISRKGDQAVIVVIGDIQEDSEEKVRSQLGISRYPECELHMFTKTEWLLQDPRLEKMAEKIKMIRDPLSGGSQKRNLNEESNNFKDSQNRKHGATFFIRDTTQETSHWLEPVLRTNNKMDFTVTKISKIKKQLSKMTEIDPINCILHFNKETFHRITKKENSGVTAIDGKIRQKLGSKVQSLVVVVDDVDDDGSEDSLRALYDKTRLSRSVPLVVFRREEKQQEFLAYFSSNKDAAETAREKWSKLQKSIETSAKATESCLPPDTEETKDIRNFTTVGIFSRSSSIDYSWMEKMLNSPDLHLPISRVRCFCISNNQTLQIFEELNICTFGILYHTKNRGRVNVTDVTDSLYDEELETMSRLLGRNNVIVVIDDLTDNSLEESERILKSQPKIKTYAFNLLLVTEKEKKDEPHLLERLREALMFKGEEKGKNDTEENVNKSEGNVSNGDSEKKPKNERVSEKKPESKQDSEKKPDINQVSEKKLNTNQDSEKKPDINQVSEKKPESKQDSEKKLNTNQDSEKKPDINQVSEKKLHINQDSEKKPNINQDSDKKSDINQDSEKKPQSKQDSEKKSDINQVSENDQNPSTPL